jgi:rhodanese-related sulfurtransferase
MADGGAAERPVEVACASCPIARGAWAVLGWLLRRCPHAARAVALLGATLVAATVANALNPLGLPWLPSPGNRVGIPRAFEGRLPQIDAVKALSLYEAGEALFVDSRDAEDYEKDHVPGAVNVPMREWVDLGQDVEAVLPQDRLLVLYCYGAHCGLSTRQGKALLEKGYGKLVVLDYGWATWTESGCPTVKHPAGGEP